MVSIKKHVFVYFLSFFVLSCIISQTFASNNHKRFLPEELPNLIIGYNLYAAYYEDFKKLWESDNKPWLINKLNSEFETLGCDIDRRMAFTHTSFIVQNNMSGHFSGFILTNNEKAREIEASLKNILFVTTPVKSMGNSILVVLSSVAPERTTIMSVDSKLNVKLLYDSYNLKFNNKTLCSIYAIRVNQPGVFVLKERYSRRCVPKEIKRSFIVDVSSGKFIISEQ